MTEDEWLGCDEPEKMLRVVHGTRPSERKTRLFNAAVCRRYWEYLPEASQVVLKTSEFLADGLAPKSHGRDLCTIANAVVAQLDQRYPAKRYPSMEARIQRDAAAAVCYAVLPNELYGAAAYFWNLDETEKSVHAILIRDVFVNPFRPAVVDPTWRSTNGGPVVELAQAIYTDRAFDRMPELADALENADCPDADVLDHCRQAGFHVRGCWLVDMLIGKT